MEKVKKLKTEMSLYKYVYIFGAGFRAKVLTGILLSEMKEVCFKSVVVTDKEKATIDFCWDIPVVALCEVHSPDKESLFLIGTVDAYRKEICMELQAAGYTNHIYIPEKEFQGLKCRYVIKRYGECFGAKQKTRDNEKDLHDIDTVIKVYMVKSEKDKKLKDHPVKDSDLIPIQGGSAISNSQITTLRDDGGRNISQKNLWLNEFTVIYWLWKNATKDSDYIGLCHYRRLFDLDHVLDRIKQERPDVVLAEPEILFPTIETHYGSVHFKEDFLLMRSILRRLYPEYVEIAEKYFSQELFIPYNMMIAKSAIFAEYAEWIFPLLEEFEKEWRPRGDAYEDRAPAFLGEWMTGVFFLYHRNRFKLMYTKILLLETKG